MLKRNAMGNLVWSRYWLAVIFGGNYNDSTKNLSGWHPNIIRHIIKYYREGWNKHPRYTLWKWIRGLTKS